QVAEQIRLALESLGLTHAGSPWRRLSLSAGVNVCLPQPLGVVVNGPDGLLQGADKALYAAKAAGRDRVVLYDEQVEQLIG
ncbi:MAG TPA: hypothetical protein VLF16_13105, partial [Pseudomonas sp.]|nr:hypothetical protein [Pseudomonas sp.]